jgi:hypothetical protein
MPKNPAIQLALCAVVVVWSLYQLFAPGEAQPGILVAFDWFAAIGGSLGALGAIYQLATGTRLGEKEKPQ